MKLFLKIFSPFLLCVVITNWLVLFLLPDMPVKAAELGCCTVFTLPVTLVGTYNWDSATCLAYPSSHPSSYVNFDPSGESLDGTSCTAKKAKNDAVDSSLPIITNPLDAPNLSVQIPGLTSFGQVTCDSTSCTIPWLSNYINGLYRYGIGAVVILAVITMIIAGVVWITAGGKEERISDAKQWVAGSLMGLLVAFSSYIILDIINPALIVLSPLKITYVPKIDLDITPMQETPTNDVVGTTIQSKGQQCFLDTFGNSESAVQHNLVSISMFGKYIQVNKLAADAFTRVNNQLYGQVNYNFYDLGTFAWRANRNNASSLSLHSFGIAIDINPKQNPNSKTSKKPCQTDLPATVINTFKSNGFRWGGDYKTVCDAMHFEWLGPCQK